MFLDDQLLEIGRTVTVWSEEKEIFEAINKMIQACMGNISDNTPRKANEQALKSAFRRVNNTWRQVAEILEKEQRGVIRVDGFEAFVKSKEEFKGLL